MAKPERTWTQFDDGLLRAAWIAELADSGRLPVPVLALNYLDPGKPAPFNLFQWGLAPEDEARQAAERAIASAMPSIGSSRSREASRQSSIALRLLTTSPMPAATSSAGAART